MEPAITPTTTASDELVWVSCGLCWGQGRILDAVDAPNGEGTMHRIYPCPSCLGMGQDLQVAA